MVIHELDQEGIDYLLASCRESVELSSLVGRIISLDVACVNQLNGFKDVFGSAFGDIAFLRGRLSFSLNELGIIKFETYSGRFIGELKK